MIAPRLLPARTIDLENASPRLFDARLHIAEGSTWIDKTLSEAKAATGGDMNVVRIKRGETFIMPLPDVTLREGDSLRVRDTPQHLKAFEQALGTRLYSGEHVVDEERPLAAENQLLAEIAVVEGSSLDRTNLKFARFIDRYQLAVLALHRQAKTSGGQVKVFRTSYCNPPTFYSFKARANRSACSSRAPNSW